MSSKNLILLILAFVSTVISAQTNYEITTPDSIQKMCQKAIISEIGKNAFNTSVKYIKSDLSTAKNIKGEKEDNYTVFYAFAFPNVKESHVVFSFNCIRDSKGTRLVKDSAFKNFTRLPVSLKNKPVKILSYSNAKKLAADADPVMKVNQDKLFGDISTEYNEKTKDYYFVWHFYYMASCKDCGAEQFKIYSSSIDAVTGKVIPSPSK
jgi:hypothetical protein